MGVINPYEIIHAENWAALAVCILHRVPIPPEIAWEVLENGAIKIGEPGKPGSAARTVRVIKALRAQGMSWSQITIVTGLRSPAAIMSHWRKRHEKGRNQHEPIRV